MSQPPSGPDPYGPSGGPGQPPAQGGWAGQPPQPGPYGVPAQSGTPGQYGSPGQYGQPGPYGSPGQYGAPGPHGGVPGPYGAPGPYGMPGQYGAPGGGRSGRQGLVALVAGVVLVIAIAATLFLVLGDDDDPAPAAATATSSEPVRPSRSPSPGRTPLPPPLPPPTPVAPAPAPGLDFVATLPVDLTGCSERELAGDGDVAAATCGAALTQPGPTEAQFHLYADQATLDEVFSRDVEGRGFPEFPGEPDCTGSQGIGEWSGAGSSGRLACALIDGRPWLYWTDDVALTEGIVVGEGGTQADLAALYEWWTTNSDYVR